MRSDRSAIGLFVSCVVCDGEEEAGGEHRAHYFSIRANTLAEWFDDHRGNAFLVQQTPDLAAA